MSSTYEAEKKNSVRQLRDKAHYDKDTVHAVLDAGLVAQVTFSGAPGPAVVPMIYARDGEVIYLHGARKARVVRMLEHADEACLNVTLVDGIVLARSAFNSSMNFRSATVFGKPRLLDGHDEKLKAMHAISEHLMPGRWDELREPHINEVKKTGVIELTITAASAKISEGGPNDEDEDYAIPIWAGVLPLNATLGELESDDRLLPGADPSEAVRALQGRRF